MVFPVAGHTLACELLPHNFELKNDRLLSIVSPFWSDLENFIAWAVEYQDLRNTFVRTTLFWWLLSLFFKNCRVFQVCMAVALC